MVCMLVLVSSKAHSTARGLSAVTRLHSISRFSLQRGRRGGGKPVSGPTSPNNKRGECTCLGALCGPTKRCVPVSVVLFKGREGSQRVIELRGEGPELTQRHTQSPSTDVRIHRHMLLSSFLSHLCTSQSICSS